MMWFFVVFGERVFCMCMFPFKNTVGLFSACVKKKAHARVMSTTTSPCAQFFKDFVNADNSAAKGVVACSAWTFVANTFTKESVDTLLKNNAISKQDLANLKETGECFLLHEAKLSGFCSDKTPACSGYCSSKAQQVTKEHIRAAVQRLAGSAQNKESTDADSKSKLSAGELAAIVVGSLVGVVILALIVTYAVRGRQKSGK